MAQSDDDETWPEPTWESESESDIEDEIPREADRRILEETHQQETLLHKPDRVGKVKRLFQSRDARPGQPVEGRVRKLRQKNRSNGNAELIYEMEGGYKDTSSRSSLESLELKREWNDVNRSSKRRVAFYLSIVVLLLLLAIAVYKGSRTSPNQQTFSNGTHTFGPTTILISLDGFRADFLQRDLTPAMAAFVASGVSPSHMLPSFPSLTFPNHYTLVTGLYPESHGIVSNQFWDPHMQEEFYYTNTTNSMRSKWWDAAEPLWNTAEKQGLKTAIHMWPGSEAHIGNMNPTYLDRFNDSEVLDVKVDRILQWLDMPQEQRPQFIGAYVPNVDAAGHRYGPNSTEIRETIVEVDEMLTYLVEGLYARNLTEVVNIVIVSDHGMATTSMDRLIQLDDFIDLNLVDHIDGWPLRGLRLKDPIRDVPIVYKQLMEGSRNSAFDVYTLETMPDRYHFSNNDRIAPLWVIPKAGWAVVEKHDFDIEEARKNGNVYSPLGLHGYDHEHPLMRAIFIARGPAFPHPPNSKVPVFQNIEVYNIVCDSLGITPHTNNGTLRLPLQTEGLHSDSTTLFDKPADIIEEPVDNSISTDSTPSKPTSQAGGATLNDVLIPSSTTSIFAPSPSSTPDQADNITSKSKWWDFIHSQIQKAKDWAKQLAESFNNNKPTTDDQPV